jgi:hypothetical protein
MKKSKWIIGIAVVAALGVMGWLWLNQTRENTDLLRQNLHLKQQVARLSELEQENQRLANLLAQADGAKANQQLLELLRLRNEVALLRRQTNELHRLEEELQQLRVARAGAAQRELPTTGSSNQPVAVFPKDTWGAPGYDTPEHAFQSLNWAALNGDLQAIRAAVTAEMAKDLDKEFAERGETNMIRQVMLDFSTKAEVRIVSKTEATPSLVVLEVDDRREGATEFGSRDKLVFQRVDGVWKLAGDH